MRDGVFTKIIYDTIGNIAKRVERPVMIVGPAAYSLEQEIVGIPTALPHNLADRDRYASVLYPSSGANIAKDKDLALFVKYGEDVREIREFGRVVAAINSATEIAISGKVDIRSGDRLLMNVLSSKNGHEYTVITASYDSNTNKTTITFGAEAGLSTTPSEVTLMLFNSVFNSGIVNFNSNYNNGSKYSITQAAGEFLVECNYSEIVRVDGGDGAKLIPAAGKTAEFSALVNKLSIGDKFYDSGSQITTIIEKGSDYILTDAEATLDISSTYSFYNNLITDKDGRMKGAKILADLNANYDGISGVKEIFSLGDITELFGPGQGSKRSSLLPYHAQLAMLAAGGKSSINLYVMPSSESLSPDEQAGSLTSHEAAINKLKGYQGYFIVPVVRDSNGTSDESIEILHAYKNHCDVMSSLEEKKERRLYCSRRIFNEGVELAGYEDVNNPIYGKPFDEFNGEDPSADAGVARTIPPLFDSSRVTLMPYYAYGPGGVLLIGSEIAAVIAGWHSSLPLGYSTTWSKVPVITGMPGVDYFTIPELEMLKDAGWYMLDQAKQGSEVTCYHQYTTSSGVIEEKELSLVIGLDAFAMDLRLTERPLIANGLANRISVEKTPALEKYLTAVQNAAANIISIYVREKVFAGIKIIGISKNDSHRDWVDTKFEVSHLYPVNRINNYIHVV